MATVSDRPRARRARAPRPAAQSAAPPVAEINDRIPEGWQPGGQARPSEPAPSGPPSRHGKCSLTLSIGGTRYKLAPAIAGAPIEACWTLRKVTDDGPHGTDRPRAYCVASDGIDVHCTCPDHAHNGALCKHINSLIALRLVPAPIPAGRKGGAQ